MDLFKKKHKKPDLNKYAFIASSKIGDWYMPLDITSICHARHLGVNHAVHDDSLYLDKSEMVKGNEIESDYMKQAKALLTTKDYEGALYALELAEDQNKLNAFYLKHFDNERFIHNLCTYYTILATKDYIEDETDTDMSILKLKVDYLEKDEGLKKKLQVWFIQSLGLSKDTSTENFLLLMKERKQAYIGLKLVLDEKIKTFQSYKKTSTNSSVKKQTTFWGS